MDLLTQVGTLLILALPVACVAWTVTHEEVFREPREFCECRSRECRTIFQRKFFYLFTCEYCFSHYVALFFLILTRFHLLFDDWRGYIIAFFALVWIANQYMSLFTRLRVDIRSERREAEIKERLLQASAPPAKLVAAKGATSGAARLEVNEHVASLHSHRE